MKAVDQVTDATQATNTIATHTMNTILMWTVHLATFNQPATEMTAEQARIRIVNAAGMAAALVEKFPHLANQGPSGGKVR